MKIDKERREFLIRLAQRISTEMMSLGFTSFENVSEEVWNGAFLESIHPLVDNAIAEYKPGAHDIFLWECVRAAMKRVPNYEKAYKIVCMVDQIR